MGVDWNWEIVILTPLGLVVGLVGADGVGQFLVGTVREWRNHGDTIWQRTLSLLVFEPWGALLFLVVVAALGTAIFSVGANLLPITIRWKSDLERWALWGYHVDGNTDTPWR